MSRIDVLYWNTQFNHLNYLSYGGPIRLNQPNRWVSLGIAGASAVPWAITPMEARGPAAVPGRQEGIRFFPNKNSFRKGVSYPTGIKKYGWDDYCYVDK